MSARGLRLHISRRSEIGITSNLGSGMKTLEQLWSSQASSVSGFVDSNQLQTS